MPPLDTTSPHSPDPALIAAEMAHCRATMLRLMDQAAEVAGKLHGQIMAQPDPAPATDGAAAGAAPVSRVDHTLSFERAVKTARRTALLVRYLALPLPMHAAETVGASRVAKRKFIIRRVEDEVARQGDGAWAEQVLAEFHERIEMPEFEAELAEREESNLLREVLCDLGLDTVGGVTYWKRRTPADLAILAALAAKPPAPAPLAVAPGGGGAVVPRPTPITDTQRAPALHPADAVATMLARAGRLRSG